MKRREKLDNIEDIESLKEEEREYVTRGKENCPGSKKVDEVKLRDKKQLIKERNLREYMKEKG